MQRASRTVPGTGLSPLVYGLLVAFSVALFLFWGGPLWTASREASHVGRFAFSYLLVLPAAAVLLLATRRFTWSHLVGATGSAWGIKLVITSALYFSLARGTAHLPTAAVTTSSAKGKTAFVADYAPAKGEFPRGTITGSVLQGNTPVAGAVVLIDRPRPGRALSDDAPPFKMTIAGSRYGGLVYVGRTDGAFEIESRDPVLHTLHLYELGRGKAASERAIMNVPVPAGGAPRPFSAPEPGVYEARCDTHPSERASVVIADHPYVARTDEEGKFTLADVPEGPLTLVVVAREPAEDLAGEDQNTKSAVRHVPARVEASETTTVHIDLSTPEAAEERL